MKARYNNLKNGLSTKINIKKNLRKLISLCFSVNPVAIA